MSRRKEPYQPYEPINHGNGAYEATGKRAPAHRREGVIRRNARKIGGYAAVAAAGVGLAVAVAAGAESMKHQSEADAAKEAQKHAAEQLAIDKAVSPELNKVGAYLKQVYEKHPDKFTKTETPQGDVEIDRQVKDLSTGFMDEVKVVYGKSPNGAADISNVKFVEFSEPNADGENYSGLVVANNAGSAYAKESTLGMYLTDAADNPYESGALAGVYDTSGDIGHSGSNTFNSHQYNFFTPTAEGTAHKLADDLVQKAYVMNSDIAELPPQ
jgi:hypothetical protein